MPSNKTKIDRIHDLLPKLYKTRINPNWKAFVEAFGQQDEDLSNLISEVRKQFFVKTASRPYIDRLAANNKISRPRQIGMDDATMRQYVPIMAYAPKQVKLALDQLIDIFFYKEATTAFVQSTSSSPYFIKDNWTLEYRVDGLHDERITFVAADFLNIAAATAEEIVSAVNRNAAYSFAILFQDHITAKKYIRVFSLTVGSKGSVGVVGGLSNLAFLFHGAVDGAGSGSNTTWDITQVGDVMSFVRTGGALVHLEFVQAGDIALVDIPNNEGTFLVTSVNSATDTFQFANLFGTIGTFTHSSPADGRSVRFFRPEKSCVFKADYRAIVWEVQPGEIIIEMPPTPPVVKRDLKGGAHINGLTSSVLSVIDPTSLDMENIADWPVAGGQFVLRHNNNIKTHIKTVLVDEVLDNAFRSGFDIEQKYAYTSKSGSQLLGITPNLPDVATVHEVDLINASRDTNYIVTIQTAPGHGLIVGENVNVNGLTGSPTSMNGTFVVATTPSPNIFTYVQSGPVDSTIGPGIHGHIRYERIELAAAGSVAYLTSAQFSTGILGPYVWDTKAPFVLSSLTGVLTSDILAGNNPRTLTIVTPNAVPNQEGFLIFDYGTTIEEGPVRYLYKPTIGTIQIDPTYIFQHNHVAGGVVNVILRKGAHVMSGLGLEYPCYITDASVARFALENLCQQVKSVGIFLNFLIRWPDQLYSYLDVYKSGRSGLWPINDEEKAKLVP